MSAPAATPTASPPRPAGRLLLGAVVTFVAGMAATAVAIAAGQHVHDLRQAQCQHLFKPITAEMPAYALPTAIVGAVLAALAVGLGAVAYRRAAASGSGGLKVMAAVLLVLAVLGTLFALWLGVYAVIQETPIQPTHCVG
jgi:hypothetical protein